MASTLNSVIEQGKDLVNSYLNKESSTSEPAPSATSDAAETSGLGVNQLGSDRGDATFSGDIERESGPGVTGGEGGEAYMAYNASGRDNTGSFNGGANEDVQNVGAGEIPGRF
ncbi:hypothetical protein JCM8547_003399 [Rhodosporidiobolus lusitaniae]